jgi:hypothetical protein
MSDPQVLDRGGVWQRAWSDSREQWRGAIVGAILIGLAAAAAGAFVPTTDDISARVAWAVGLFVAAVALVALAVYGVALVNAPVRQRDEARRTVLDLEAEIERRDAIRFAVELSIEELEDHHPWNVPEGEPAGVPYTRNIIFWVRVANAGPTAHFAAQLLNVDGLPGRDEAIVHDGRVDEVAWEHTYDQEKVIVQGGSARLRLANLARQPTVLNGYEWGPCFWFWGARSAVWSPNSHQVGWRHRRQWCVNRAITFDIVVTDTTNGQSRLQKARIDFAEAGELPELSPVGDLEVFDLATVLNA